MKKDISPIYSIERLEQILNTIPQLLRAIDENEMQFKSSPDKWSKKQILGHLIDSASINHHRFVRGQFEDVPEISYDQDKWNDHSYYQQIDTKQIIDLWTVYNRQILEITKRIPSGHWQRMIRVKDDRFTLEFILSDYVHHMEHHLRQVVNY